jgi:RNA polymerase sigma-70 factor (ECF subfamily)
VDPDRDDAARLRRGDTAGLAGLMGRHQDRLFRYLMRLVGDEAVAEDVFQQTWLQVAERVSRYDGARPFGPWLFAVARNLYFSWRRSRAVDEARTSGLDPAWPAPERGDSPFEAAARAELERRVEAALGRLSLRDREVLLLVGAEGMTPSEAAEVCGLPAVTLRARLHRARERLAAEMGTAGSVPRAKAG